LAHGPRMRPTFPRRFAPGTLMARVVIPLARAGDLPSICVCCGQPATRVRQQQFRVNEALSAAVLVTSGALGGLAWTERGITLTLPGATATAAADGARPERSCGAWG